MNKLLQFSNKKDDMNMRNFLKYIYDSYLGKTRDGK